MKKDAPKIKDDAYRLIQTHLHLVNQDTSKRAKPDFVLKVCPIVVLDTAGREQQWSSAWEAQRISAVRMKN